MFAEAGFAKPFFLASLQRRQYPFSCAASVQALPLWCSWLVLKHLHWDTFSTCVSEYLSMGTELASRHGPCASRLDRHGHWRSNRRQAFHISRRGVACPNVGQRGGCLARRTPAASWRNRRSQSLTAVKHHLCEHDDCNSTQNTYRSHGRKEMDKPPHR